MRIRPATLGDLDLLGGLVAELEAELPPTPYEEDSWERDVPKVRAMIERGVALIAEDEGRPVGYALARFGEHGPATAFVTDLYVREPERRRGLGRELLGAVNAAARERGCTHLLLEVAAGNRDAQRFYERLGFLEGSRILVTEVGALANVLEAPRGESFGKVHVQTDDAARVEQAVAQYLPRLARDVAAVVEPGTAWTAVVPTPFEGDVPRKLAHELSQRFGVTLLLAVEHDAVVRFVLEDHGRVVDEYLSLPEYYGALPPGDVLALRANPTVVSRLTGADPGRVRAAARSASSPAELPPPRQLYEELAATLGVAP